MSIITTAAVGAAIYFCLRPFGKLLYLKWDAGEDLKDYLSTVRKQQKPLIDILFVMEENGILTETLRDRLETAYSATVNSRTWDEIAFADRVSAEVLDEVQDLLEGVVLAKHATRYDNARTHANTNDGELLVIRHEVQRKTDRLNGSLVHYVGWLATLLRVPTYSFSQPVEWNPDREPRSPRYWRLGGCTFLV